ncbi:MAG: hypothetical protein VKK05_09305, partial [Synechococcus sp.]|nr:hypothetical protein [Synechococcus sp.]
LTVAGATNPAISIIDTTNNTDARIRTNDNGDLILEADVNQEGASSRMAFRVDASELMCIQSTGNVGVGTTSPAYALDCSSSAETAIRINSGAGYNAALRFSQAGTNKAFVNYLNGGGLTFGPAGSETLRIDSSGRVGIGTSSPSSDLHVKDNSTSYAALTLENSSSQKFEISTAPSNGAYLYAPNGTGSYLGFWTLNSERVRIDSSGRVGVGTASPGDYSGASTQLSIAAAGNSGLNVVSGTSSTGIIRFADGTAGDAAYRGRVEYMHDVDALMFGTAGTERLRIDSSGRVGIGTSTARAGLTVGIGGNTIPAAGATTGAAIFGNAQDGGLYGLVVGATSAGLGYIQAQRADGTATTYNLSLQPNGGNVGVGTTTPQAPLSISNGGANGIEIYSNYVGTGQSGVTSFNRSTSQRTDLYISTDETILLTGGSERCRIDASGRLLVGTSSVIGTSSNPSYYSLLTIKGAAASSTGQGQITLAKGEGS